MADVAAQQAQPAAQDSQQQDQQGGGMFSGFFGGIVRMLVIMTIFNTITGYLRGPPKDVATGKVLPPHAPLWPIGQEFSFQTYFSTSNTSYAGSEAFWREKFIYFNGEQVNARKISLNLTAADAKYAPFYKVFFFTKKKIFVNENLTIFEAHCKQWIFICTCCLHSSWCIS